MRATRAIGIIVIVLVVIMLTAGGCSFGLPSEPQTSNLSEDPSETTTEVPVTTVRALSWQEQYVGVLRTYIDPDSDPDYPSSAMFNVYDLDGDGTPELIISASDYHGAEAEIFTLYRGAVYCLGVFGSWGDFQYNPVNRYIYSSYMGMGRYHETIYKIIDGRAIEIDSFVDDLSGISEGVDPGEVDDDQYGHKNIDIDFTARKYNLNEEEIARALGLPN